MIDEQSDNQQHAEEPTAAVAPIPPAEAPPHQADAHDLPPLPEPVEANPIRGQVAADQAEASAASAPEGAVKPAPGVKPTPGIKPGSGRPQPGRPNARPLPARQPAGKQAARPVPGKQPARPVPGKQPAGKQAARPVPGKQPARPVPGKQPARPVPGKQPAGTEAAPATEADTEATEATEAIDAAGASLSPARAAARDRKAREIERRRAAAAAAAKAKRKRQVLTLIGAALAVILVVVLVVVTHKSTPKTNLTVPTTGNFTTLGTLTAPAVGPAGPEVAALAPGAILAPTNPTGNTIDGVQCQTNEQVQYHIHAHLALFVNGEPRSVPYGIGIVGATPQQGTQFVSTGTCFYWIHTHAADGIIHVESPNATVYTLGTFFDIWGAPLTANQVGSEHGKVTVFYNDKLFTGADPRTIPLTPHAKIQIEVGKPYVSPEAVNFGSL